MKFFCAFGAFGAGQREPCSEATGPIEAKFHTEPLWDGAMKVYSNGSGHMTKMAAMPIYGKNLK